MFRSIFLAVVLLGGATSAQAQTDKNQRIIKAERIAVLPPQTISSSTELYSGLAAPATLTESQLLERLAQLYGYQSDFLSADAGGDHVLALDVLEEAMTDLADLMRRENVRDERRFLDIYRILVAEYEQLFGPSDSLLVAFGDIFSFRTELFAALDNTRDPLLEDVLSATFQPIETTVPMPVNRLVETTIGSLLREPERHLNHWQSRADTYFPMIERIFREEDVPDELKYLAMIESGLNPRAKSWARAVGMWQFIAATGRAYGLEVNAWVDERMDPEKSTRAAARHLKDLYAKYGDWHIALAGYNCSPRCISRAIRRAKAAGAAEPTYWDMYRYLPRETRGYVPMFIATAFITSNPAAFDLLPVEPGPAYEYHLVPVRGMLSLSDLAEMAGTDVTTMKALNPNLRRSTLPPSTGSFYLRIPLGTFDTFTAVYDALPESAKRPSGEYIVRKGDTLGKIGRQYGVSVSRLMQKNGLRSTRIGIGRRLVVPLSDYSGSTPVPSLSEAPGAVVRYGHRTTRPIVSIKPIEQRYTQPVSTPIALVSTKVTPSGPSNSTKDDAAGKTRIVYQVRRGDTLGKIGARYGVTVSKLKSWNNLRGSRINSGQRLSIYSDVDKTAGRPSGEPITYRVKRGDTLSEIAEAHGVRLSQLRQWNGIRGSRIRVGQRLTIRINSNMKTLIHTVRRGDTLIEIAGRYAVTVAKIKDWNNLRSNTIRIGRQLKIFR